MTDTLERKAIRVLEALADGKKHRESTLPRAGAEYMRVVMCLHLGLIDGAGIDDDRGTGNYRHTRFYWITDKGRAALAKAREGQS